MSSIRRVREAVGASRETGHPADTDRPGVAAHILPPLVPVVTVAPAGVGVASLPRLPAAAGRRSPLVPVVPVAPAGVGVAPLPRLPAVAGRRPPLVPVVTVAPAVLGAAHLAPVVDDRRQPPAVARRIPRVPVVAAQPLEAPAAAPRIAQHLGDGAVLAPVQVLGAGSVVAALRAALAVEGSAAALAPVPQVVPLQIPPARLPLPRELAPLAVPPTFVPATEVLDAPVAMVPLPPVADLPEPTPATKIHRYEIYQRHVRSSRGAMLSARVTRGIGGILTAGGTMYETTRALFQGASGAVSFARRGDDLVALKSLVVVGDGEARRVAGKVGTTSLSEARREVAEMRSAGFQVHDYVTVPNITGTKVRHVIVMDAMAGTVEDLITDIQHRPNGAGKRDACLSFARDSLTFLTGLHDQGKVHCDFKDKNVFLGPDGRVRGGDLGTLADAGVRRVPIRCTAYVRSPEDFDAYFDTGSGYPTAAGDYWSWAITAAQVFAAGIADHEFGLPWFTRYGDTAADQSTYDERLEQEMLAYFIPWAEGRPTVGPGGDPALFARACAYYDVWFSRIAELDREFAEHLRPLFSLDPEVRVVAAAAMRTYLQANAPAESPDMLRDIMAERHRRLEARVEVELARRRRAGLPGA